MDICCCVFWAKLGYIMSKEHKLRTQDPAYTKQHTAQATVNL